MVDNLNDNPTRVSSRDVDTLEKIDKLMRDGTLNGFNEEDHATLQKVITIVRGFEAIGSFAGFIRKTILYTALFIGTIIAIRNNFAEYVLHIVKGN